MAVSEKKVTGKFYRIWSAADKLWHRISFWTHANDVEFNDGKTAQTKLGDIKGITVSTNTKEIGYAADATTVTTLNQSVAELNQSLGNLKTDLNKLNSLGNISIMKMGTKILEILPGNNSCLLLSKNDVISALGLSSSTFNFDNLCVSITNGDGAAFSGHLESPTITTTGIYVVWKDKVTASCNIRVNYILFYHD